MPPEYRTRFAPSPTGLLHLGHAYSGLTAWDRAQAQGGTFLLRIEDIDTPRCRPEYESAIYEDLGWLGLDWAPPMRQSSRMPAYRDALEQLATAGLTYPCRCTRGDIRAALSAPQEGGPDGPVYPGTCRHREGPPAPGDAIRLNMRRALEHLGILPTFVETGPMRPGRHQASAEDLVERVGDVVLARRDIGTSYHLAVVVDDAEQGVTEAVRGMDLFEATAFHCVLGALLGLPPVSYHHHGLIRDDTGQRLAKRDNARAIRLYRQEGLTPADIRARLGL